MSHEHHHEHSFTSKEEQLALLSYMTEHNKHHESELHELAHEIDGSTGELIHQALSYFAKGNELLTRALEQMQKGE